MIDSARRDWVDRVEDPSVVDQELGVLEEVLLGGLEEAAIAPRQRRSPA
jgi:hypothetical protein